MNRGALNARKFSDEEFFSAIVLQNFSIQNLLHRPFISHNQCRELNLSLLNHYRFFRVFSKIFRDIFFFDGSGNFSGLRVGGCLMPASYQITAIKFKVFFVQIHLESGVFQCFLSFLFNNKTLFSGIEHLRVHRPQGFSFTGWFRHCGTAVGSSSSRVLRLGGSASWFSFSNVGFGFLLLLS